MAKYWPHILIIGLSLLAYSPMFTADFTNWDDPHLITQNERVKEISIDNIFGGTKSVHYKPMVLLSWAIEYQLVGERPLLYHIDNLLLHILNSLLVLWFLRKLGFDLILAAFGALIFALHPMHAASVAWMSERKDLLFSFFYLSAMITYLNFIRSEKYQWILLTFILFLFGLMSKMMAVSLPLALIWLEYHESGNFDKKKLSRPLIFMLPIALLLVVYKSPRGMIGKMFGVSSYIDQYYNFGESLVLSMIQYGSYLLRAILPFKLSALYAYPASIGMLEYVLALIGLLLVGWMLWLLFRNKKAAYGLLFYTITIWPITQLFFPRAHAFMSDNYIYLSLLGIIIMILYLLRSYVQSRVFKILAILIILFMSLGSYMRASVWKNSFTLWNDVIEHDPGQALAYANRGLAYQDEGQPDKAIKDLEKAVSLKDDQQFKNNLLALYQLQGEDKKAVDLLGQIDSDSENPQALNNQAAVLIKNKQAKEAIALLDRAIAMDSTISEFYFNRGRAWQDLQEDKKAEQDYRQCLRMDSIHARAMNNMGLIHEKRGNQAGNATSGVYYMQAEAFFAKAIEVDPELIMAKENLGRTLVLTAKYQDALNVLGELIASGQGNANVYFYLGLSFLQLNKIEKAEDSFKKALELNDKFGAAAYNLAGISFQRGEYKKAAQYLNRASELNYPIEPAFSQAVKQKLKS